jgi:hypothetical protein
MFRIKKLAFPLFAVLIVGLLSLLASCGKETDDAWKSFQLVMDKFVLERTNWEAASHTYDQATDTLTVNGLKFNLSGYSEKESPEAPEQQTLNEILKSPVTMKTVNITGLLGSKDVEKLLSSTTWKGLSTTGLAKSVAIEGIEYAIKSQGIEALAKSEKLDFSEIALAPAQEGTPEGKIGFLKCLTFKDSSQTGLTFTFKAQGDAAGAPENIDILFEIANSTAQDVGFGAEPIGESSDFFDIVLSETVKKSTFSGIKLKGKALTHSFELSLQEIENNDVNGVARVGKQILKGLVLDLKIDNPDIQGVQASLKEAELNGQDHFQHFQKLLGALKAVLSDQDPNAFDQVSTMDKIFTYPFSLDSGKFKDAKLNLENLFSLSLDSFDFEGPVKAFTLSNSKVKVNGLKLTLPSTGGNTDFLREAKKFVEDFGQDTFEINYAYTVTHEDQKPSRYVIEMLEAKDNFSLSGTLALAGVNQELIDDLGQIPSSQVGIELLFLPSVMNVGIFEANLNYKDLSLVNKLFKRMARESGSSIDDAKAAYVETQEKNLDSDDVLDDESKLKLLELIKNFVYDPQSADLSIKPAEPVSAKSLAPTGFDYQKVLLLLNISVGANGSAPYVLKGAQSSTQAPLPAPNDLIIEEDTILEEDIPLPGDNDAGSPPQPSTN